LGLGVTFPLVDQSRNSQIPLTSAGLSQEIINLNKYIVICT
jgi:hypothetical protein